MLREPGVREIIHKGRIRNILALADADSGVDPMASNALLASLDAQRLRRSDHVNAFACKMNQDFQAGWEAVTGIWNTRWVICDKSCETSASGRFVEIIETESRSISVRFLTPFIQFSIYSIIIKTEFKKG